MPKKRRPAVAKRKPISESTRAKDDALREELRHFDLAKFDTALARAIAPPKR